METITIFSVLILFLAHISHHRRFEVVGTELGYGVKESQIIFEYPILDEIIMDGLTYKEALYRCQKLKNQQ
jgi:hypothetical protein